MKICNVCNQDLPLDAFSDHPGTVDRKQQHCKPCQAQLSAELRERQQREKTESKAAAYIERHTQRRAEEAAIASTLMSEKQRPDSNASRMFLDRDFQESSGWLNAISKYQPPVKKLAHWSVA